MGDTKRVVNTAFWNDRVVSDDFSPEDKYFYLYLLTNPHTTQLGIYELPISKASQEMGYTREAIKVLLDRFQNKYKMIRYSEETAEVAIKYYLRHSVIKGGKPVFDCLKKDLQKVKDLSLVQFIYKNLEDKDGINETVRSFLEYIKDNNRELLNDNDNDNDNERNVHDSLTIRQNVSNYAGRVNIPYQQIADTYNSICVSFPRLTTLSDNRKKAIKARINSGYSVDDITRVFEKAEASDFLKGKNDRNWSATFDWMLKDANMAKILDGNYDNKTNGATSTSGSAYMDAIKNRVNVVDSWV